MKIAVSGTHASGKSTLIELFLLAHPEFAHEPEPWQQMRDQGEDFAAEATAEAIQRQLAFSLERLAENTDPQVIFERCPVDFLAYLLALGADELAQEALAEVREAQARLDAIVFLPLDRAQPIQVSEREDPQLRAAVDQHLNELLREDAWDLLASGPRLLVVEGSEQQRLQALERAIGDSLC